jgi:hypothetical protein
MISRRAFARGAGLVAGAALLPRRAAAADPAAAPAPAKKPPATPAGPAASAAAHAEAEARVQLIVARYGSRLSAADKSELSRLSLEAQKALDEVRAYPLDWSDEPATVFRAPRRR